MEHIPEKEKTTQEQFAERMKVLGLVDEVRPGLPLNEAEYTPGIGDEFATKDFIYKVTSFVSTPMFIDSFTSHEEERIPAFNHSGIFDDFDRDLYMQNRLRLNKSRSLLSAIRSMAGVREFPESFREAAQKMSNDFNTNGFKDWENEERVIFTEKLTNAVVELFNQAIDEGVVKGEKVVQ